MIDIGKDIVTISVDTTDVEKSIALLTDMLEFCQKQDIETEGKKETAAALTTAIETMKAFWCEHFSEEDQNE